jgi:hypothetical protein
MILKMRKPLLIILAILALSVASLARPAFAALPPDPGVTSAPAAKTGTQKNAANTQTAATTTPSGAQSAIQCGINQASGGDCSAGSKDPGGDLATIIKNILNILSAVAGVIAVVMIIVAGLRLVTSAGNENAVKGAKGTLIYAIIGLVLIAFAQIIVHFVISNVA